MLGKRKKRAGVGHLRNPRNAIVSVVYYLLKSALCSSKVKGQRTSESGSSVVVVELGQDRFDELDFERGWELHPNWVTCPSSFDALRKAGGQRPATRLTPFFGLGGL